MRACFVCTLTYLALHLHSSIRLFIGRPGGAPSNAALTKQWLHQLSALLIDGSLTCTLTSVLLLLHPPTHSPVNRSAWGRPTNAALAKQWLRQLLMLPMDTNLTCTLTTVLLHLHSPTHSPVYRSAWRRPYKCCADKAVAATAIDAAGRQEP